MVMFNPFATKFIYLVTSAEYAGPLNWPITVKGIDFINNWNRWNYNTFEFLCKFDGSLDFWWCFLCGKLTKPCCHARTFQLVSQQSLTSIITKKAKILIKQLPVANTVPSGMNTIFGALVYRDIPSDLWSRPEQSHHLPGSLLPNDHRQPTEFPILTYIWQYWQNLSLWLWSLFI